MCVDFLNIQIWSSLNSLVQYKDLLAFLLRNGFLFVALIRYLLLWIVNNKESIYLLLLQGNNGLHFMIWGVGGHVGYIYKPLLCFHFYF